MNIFEKWNYSIFLFIIRFYFITNEIIFVYEHSRHGARGSINVNKGVLENNSFFDEYHSHWIGNGELTLKGKMQQYILGIRNRYKYPNLIDYNNYNRDELLVHVTNTSRSMESAFNQVLGMFKPSIDLLIDDKSIENISTSNIYYYPPNINNWKNQTNKNIYRNIINEAELSIKLLKGKKNNLTSSFLTDGMFVLEEKNKQFNLNIQYEPFPDNRTFFLIYNCPNYEKYIEINKNREFEKVIKDNLENKYGKKLQSFFKYESKEFLYDYHNSIIIIDNYLANYFDNRDLKEFFEKTGTDKEDYFLRCSYIYKWWLYNIFCDAKACILESQKLMEDLCNYFDNKINNKNSKLKMVIDVGHDFTVGPMQLFMHEVFDIQHSVCFFSCNLYFELHKEQDKNKKDIYFIKYYIDDSLVLNINYEEFKKKVISKFWTEKEKDEFCNGNNMKSLRIKIPLFLFFFAISIGGLILVLYECYLKCLSKKDKKILKENDTEMEFI